MLNQGLGELVNQCHQTSISFGQAGTDWGIKSLQRHLHENQTRLPDRKLVKSASLYYPEIGFKWEVLPGTAWLNSMFIDYLPDEPNFFEKSYSFCLLNH